MAAPATVSGECSPREATGQPGRPSERPDPRARRPAVIVCPRPGGVPRGIAFGDVVPSSRFVLRGKRIKGSSRLPTTARARCLGIEESLHVSPSIHFPRRPGFTATRNTAVLQAAMAILLGFLVIGVVGFSHIEVANAAHDTRHSNAFPCH